MAFPYKSFATALGSKFMRYGRKARHHNRCEYCGNNALCWFLKLGFLTQTQAKCNIVAICARQAVFPRRIQHSL